MQKHTEGLLFQKVIFVFLEATLHNIYILTMDLMTQEQLSRYPLLAHFFGSENSINLVDALCLLDV